jgi:hypothetical protein
MIAPRQRVRNAAGVQYHHGRGRIFRMAQGQMRARDAELRATRGGAAVKEQLRPAPVRSAHLHIARGDAPGEAGAQSLDARFLRREAGRGVRRDVALGGGAQFRFGEYLFQKTEPETGESGVNPAQFHKIKPQTDDHGGVRRLRLARRAKKAYLLFFRSIFRMKTLRRRENVAARP